MNIRCIQDEATYGKLIRHNVEIQQKNLLKYFIEVSPLAIALAVRVLPVPGLPYNSTPVGQGTMLRVPERMEGRSECCMSQTGFDKEKECGLNEGRKREGGMKEGKDEGMKGGMKG